MARPRNPLTPPEMAAAQRSAATTGTVPPAPAVHIPSKAKYVNVASKLPMHITIQLCKPKTARVTGQFGSVDETVNVPFGESYVIRGIGYPSGKPPKGFPKPPTLLDEDFKGGFAVTKGIPADFFAEWLKQHADTDMVRNGMIKAEADIDDLAAAVSDFRTLDSGLGPLEVEGGPEGGTIIDRRNPKPANASISFIKPEARSAA
jgi:hypothetical protein